MIKSILLLLLILPLPLIIANSLPTVYNNYNHVQVINNITIYKNLEYKIVLEKSVTINETQTSLVNKTTTTTVKPTTVQKVISSYIVNYAVTNITGTTINVAISGNFTKNFTFIQQGNYSINLFTDIINVKYPYILPFLLLNNTYALVTSSTYVMFFAKIQNYTINGENITAYDYFIVYNSSYFQEYEILYNGYLANYSTTYNGSTLIMSLLNYYNEFNITLNSNTNPYLSQPYLYIEYLYSSTSKTLQASNYVETYYPLISGNYVGQIVYLLYPHEGKLVEPETFYGLNVNFELYFKPINDLVITFMPSNGTTITWNERLFSYVNTTPIKLVNGSIVNAMLYRNVSANTTAYLYFSQQSHILLEELIYNSLFHNYTIKLDYLGNQFVSLNQNYINVTYTTYKTLPYSLVNFNEGLIIAIVFTVIVSAIIILFRQR
ncbi:hypothetical protein EWF20_13395 [Sulfolobus sp. S-194]|uniref:hypothetical protein n=1 Tax=Sulfolobus sp. S-194 TaxID=2512240 RepID=UPI001436FE6A|nr:hypothetical protein [Sulfolobus sp. S-194]QIW25025.1 hypothetical protein EWF20_13395 [Sulfolobus sp. S-194]